MPKCLSPVTPHPGLIVTLEINGGLVHERSDPAVVITLVFLPFYANRPRENALWSALPLFNRNPCSCFIHRHAKPDLYHGNPRRQFKMAAWPRETVCCCVSDLEASRSHMFNDQPVSIWCQTVVTCLTCTSQKWLSPWRTSWHLQQPHLFFFIPICKVKELYASDWALFGPKWRLSSKTSMGNYCMLCWGFWVTVSAQLNWECSRIC